MPRIEVGSKVKFKDERQRYTVQASNDRWAICTKPFNAQRTVLYSIMDFEREVRGRENLVFCMGFENRGLCEEALKRLIAGDSEVSHRHFQTLNIESVTPSKKLLQGNSKNLAESARE